MCVIRFESVGKLGTLQKFSLGKMYFISIILQDMLQAGIQERQSKASLYKVREPQEIEPEYIPWTGENSENAVELGFLLVQWLIYVAYTWIHVRGMQLMQEIFPTPPPRGGVEDSLEQHGSDSGSIRRGKTVFTQNQN